jgi:hypothetical protein
MILRLSTKHGRPKTDLQYYANIATAFFFLPTTITIMLGVETK